MFAGDFEIEEVFYALPPHPCGEGEFYREFGLSNGKRLNPADYCALIRRSSSARIWSRRRLSVSRF